jgi:TolB-like protein
MTRPTDPTQGGASGEADETVILGSGPDRAEVAWTPGVLGGRYRVDGLIGTGGMGHVYRAFDTALGEVVALKILRRELAQRPEVTERFRREVRLARRVTHPNVARTYDLGVDGDETWITMELIDGVALSAVLAVEGALSEGRAVAIGAAVARGLAAAHDAGVIHRDLKPDNILVARDGRVVITDFGIARLTTDACSDSRGIVGTPRYMAPEQAENAADIDARADVYALGELLYELLTGRPVWLAEEAATTLVARLVDAAPELPEALAISPTLRRIVGQCLARDRALRPTNAAVVLASLDAVGASGPPSTPATGATSASGELPGSAARTEAARRPVRLTVWPFKNHGAPGDEYLSEGVAEDLADALSMSPGVRVRPVHRGGVADVNALDGGRALGVDVVVEGSVRRTADGVRLSVRLLGVLDGYQLWAIRRDCAIGELLVTSEAAALAILEALSSRWEGPERHAVRESDTVDLYLRARQAIRRAWYGGSGDAAIALLDAALVRAPDDPSVLAAMATAKARWPTLVTDLAEADRLASRAVALAPSSADAWAALATVRSHLGSPTDYAHVLAAAMRSVPRSPAILDRVGRLIAEVGPVARGLEYLLEAIDLDPSARDTRANAARARLLLGDVGGALELVSGGVAGDENEPIILGVRNRAAIWYDRADLLPAIPPGNGVSTYFGAACTAALRGDHADALGFARSLEALIPSLPAVVQTFIYQLSAEVFGTLHRRLEALRAVRAAAVTGLYDLAWLDGCPALAPVRSTPDFSASRDLVAARAAEVHAVLAVLPTPTRHNRRT